jgi:hypothetical protein
VTQKNGIEGRRAWRRAERSPSRDSEEARSGTRHGYGISLARVSSDMEHPLYVPSTDTRASVEAAQHLHELRQIVAPLHLQFSWQQNWERILSLDRRFQETEGGRESPPYPPSSFDAAPFEDTLRRGRELLLDPIPLWPADRWPASELYVARRIRLHGNAGLRCLIYPSYTGMPLWQSAALRASVMLDVIGARGTGSVMARPPHVLAKRALMLFNRWQRRAARDPAALPAARSIYAHLLDAPPVDTWHGYYTVMHGSIWRLRDFVREAAAASQPTALLVPFTLEPYARTLLAAPDYPTNLLLANVFPESPLALDTTGGERGAPESRLRHPTPPRASLERRREDKLPRTPQPAHP